MALTTALKTDIVTKLRTIVTEVAENATQIADTTNYILYNLPFKNQGEIDNRASKTITLQVDLWRTNADQNMTIIDGYADSIEALFNEQTYILTDFTYYGLLSARNDQLPTQDENTFHSQLLFELRYNEF